MTIEEVKKIGKIWEKRFNLISWKIKYSIKPLNDAYGTCIWDNINQTAKIVINSRHNDKPHTEPLESTIIHELLHIVIKGHVKYDEQTVREENVVVLLEDIIYKGYNSKRKNVSKL